MMKNETLNVKHILKNSNILFNNLLHMFNLPPLIQQIKKDALWAQGELNAKILVKKPQKQIILIVLHQGTVIDSFQANDSITIQVIEGELVFQARKESITLDKDHLLMLHENIQYKMTGSKETAFLLTITSRTQHFGAN